MIIKDLTLKSYRNYKQQNIVFCDQINNIYGRNAQGKTNIIEAIYVCVTGRSHRTIHEDELIRFQEKEAGIQLIFDNEERENSITIKLCHRSVKEVFLNEIKVKRIGELIGNLNAVMFCPENLSIVKEGPSERRRFIDIIISQIKPTYFYTLQKYNKILKQRNKILKENTTRENKIKMLEIWDILLVETAKDIIYERAQSIKALSLHVNKNHTIISEGQEDLQIRYVPSFKADSEVILRNKKAIEEVYYQQMKKNLFIDIEKNITNYGPHRDDFDIIINNSQLKTYGSQGQQRSAVLSLKLAEIDIIVSETDKMPVLLLDDVMSELDEKRRNIFMKQVKNVQTFITSTERIDEINESRIKYIQIENGQVIS